MRAVCSARWHITVVGIRLLDSKNFVPISAGAHSKAKMYGCFKTNSPSESCPVVGNGVAPGNFGSS